MASSVSTIVERDHRRPALAAAVVNAMLVFWPPVLLAVNAWRYVAATVERPPGLTNAFEVILTHATSPFMIFPLLAGWRTYVHATRYLGGTVTGWPGVLEAGALGFAVALWGMRQGIMTRTGEAPPYIIVYGGLAIVAGLVVGLVLRLSAVAVLKLYPARSFRRS